MKSNLYMKNRRLITASKGVALFFSMILVVMVSGCASETLKPRNGFIEIPVASIDDGKAHFFTVKADDGIPVRFFTLKSKDGVIRAAIDSCDVCYQSGKGYHQEGDYMICDNCGQKFSSDKINIIKGGCNPAPLNRKIVGDKLVISMQDINSNSWYCRFKV